ncbi:hypothetical protein D3C73_1394520 [compost metagenome]
MELFNGLLPHLNRLLHDSRLDLRLADGIHRFFHIVKGENMQSGYTHPLFGLQESQAIHGTEPDHEPNIRALDKHLLRLLRSLKPRNV